MLDLDSFDVSPTRGFLPDPDPATHLPQEFSPLEEIGRDLPKLLASNQLRKKAKKLPFLDVTDFCRGGSRTAPTPEERRAMLLYSFLGHAYVWEDWKNAPEKSIPKQIALPWHQLSQRLGRPPVLSYASYSLDNWRRLDPQRPIELGNLKLLQNFLGGIDEEWFILVHVEIEREAGEAIVSIGPAQEAVTQANVGAIRESPLLQSLTRHLETIAAAQERMYETLLRMRENCDPFAYYNRVRPYIHGFARHPVVYEGVEEYHGQPQRFYGETGAQSTIVPCLDVFLGIRHADDLLKEHLNQMRNYMPPRHRNLLEAIEKGPSVREFVSKNRGNKNLLQAYNRCVDLLREFRTKHIEYATDYIQKQAEVSPHNPTAFGTGGTPFIPYLTKHRDETVGL